jgi:hypothetical protein
VSQFWHFTHSLNLSAQKQNRPSGNWGGSNRVLEFYMTILPAIDGYKDREHHKKMMFAEALAFATENWNTVHQQIMTAAIIESAQNPNVRNTGEMLYAGQKALGRIPMKYRETCAELKGCRHFSQFVSVLLRVHTCISQIESLSAENESAGEL